VNPNPVVAHKFYIQTFLWGVWGGVGFGGWGNSSSKAFGISFADRPKAKNNKAEKIP
jgi:hypothetical protein